MSTQKKLSDLGLPQGEDFDSISLFTLGAGHTIVVTKVEFKQLGTRDGVILTLKDAINAGDKDWKQIHSTSERIVKKLGDEKFTAALKEGPIEMTTVGGRTGNGSWVDIE